MDPANLHLHHQHQEHEYGHGIYYYSSLLFEPDYNYSKVSRTNNMSSPGIILECWGPNSRASMCEGLTKNSSFCEQSAANDHDEFLATGDQFNNFQNSTMEISSLLSYGYSGRYNDNILSHNILPNINNNISNSDLDLNLQVLDVLNSHKCDDINGATHYSRANSQNSSTNHGQFFMGEVKNCSSTSSSNKNPITITQRKNKRCISNFIEAKKPRPPSSRSSCLQLKVRKEKLREKIATLQRLAAPYGKTDIASVLTEAIGYIQFLHDQVQTLSVPYMRPSNNNSARSVKVSSSVEDGKEQSNSDLLSRGLCLVPLSCASFFNTCNAGT